MNKPILHQSSKLIQPPNIASGTPAWVRATRHERLWTAIACWMGSLSFAGPGQWISGRPIRAGLWFIGELVLLGLWMLIAGTTGGWQLATITIALALYHFVSWVDAAQCGWFFRKLTIKNSLLRIMAMAVLVALAPAPAAILILGPGREFLVEEYFISESSMATTLLGQHAQMSCPNCGYAFKLGLRPAELDYSPHAKRRCPMCGQHNMTVANSDTPPRDRILASKMLKPRRWDLIMFRSPKNLNTLLVKRVVGLPTEELQIINGEIFINGSLLAKPPLAHQEMWPSVLDTNFQTPNSNLRWLPESNATAWQVQQQSWLFDSTKSQPELLNLTGQLTDELAYNVNALQYIQPRPIHDVRLRVRLSQFKGPGHLSLIWEHSSGQVRASITADGAASLAVRSMRKQLQDISQTAHLGRAITSSLELMLIIRDGHAYFYADKKLLAQAAIGPFDAKTAGQIRPRSCQLSIAASNCQGRISHIQLDRDIHYRTMPAKPGQFPLRSATVKIQPAHYYVLGDNSPVSHDSRLGWSIHPSLQGKIQPATVPAELVQGVVTCIYWPPSRWRTFR